MRTSRICAGLPLWLLLLLIGQLLLGVSAYVVRVIQGMNEAQPTMTLVAVTVAHLLLAR